MANQNLSVSDLSQGISVEGAKQYYRDLKTQVIDDTIKKLKETDDIKKALRDGWQGMACENFIESLDNVVFVTAKQIDKMEEVLKSEISLITQAWINQDQEMVESADLGFKDVFF